MHGLSEALDVDVRSLDLDTAVMAYLLDPGERKYDLEQLALRFLELELTSPDREEGTLDLDGDAGADETGRRAVAVLRLADALADGLSSARAPRPVRGGRAAARPRPRARWRSRASGWTARSSRSCASELQDQCDDLERKIHAHAGEPFVVNSVPQLRRILFEKLELTPVKRTKTGPSTDADSLEKMAAAKAHPILDDLMRYREVEKLRSTYADALPPLIRDDGRIHATFNQIATTTGRISSENPNLQNIPVRSEGGREMRRAFIADEGSRPAGGRLLADRAAGPRPPGRGPRADRRVRSRRGRPHDHRAAKVFDVDEEKVDAFQRRFAKVVNYGLAFGMEAYGLGQRLEHPDRPGPRDPRQLLRVVPERARRSWSARSPRRSSAATRRRSSAGAGRSRSSSSDNFRIQQMGERMAQNAPVQGSAADIFKLAMVELDRALDERDLATRMILTVHDELVFEVPLDEREAVEALVREVMESAIELRVPLVVDLGFGTSWAEAK